MVAFSFVQQKKVLPKMCKERNMIGQDSLIKYIFLDKKVFKSNWFESCTEKNAKEW